MDPLLGNGLVKSVFPIYSGISVLQRHLDGSASIRFGTLGRE